MCHFLRKFFQKSSQCFCHKKNRIAVDKNILPDEVCVRCLLHPYHIHSNQKLRSEAFVPRQNENRVSLLRIRYSSMDFAQEHGRKIAERVNAHYVGLVALTRQIVADVNRWAQSKESGVKGAYESNGIEADIVYAPMINDKEYASFEETIYLDDPEVKLPMHADLTFPEKCDKEVQTRMRQYARELVKRVQCSFVSS